MIENDFDYSDIIDDLEGLDRLKFYYESQKNKIPLSEIGELMRDDAVEDKNNEERDYLQRRIDKIKDNMERKRGVLSQQKYKLIISNPKEEKWNQQNNQNQPKQ